MKISFVIPPCFSLTVSPPLGIGCIASALEKDGHKVEIYDFPKFNVSIEKAVNMIKDKEFELIGISIFTSRYLPAKEFIKKLKEYKPNAAIVVGGVHITALTELSMRELDVDFGIVGEGEYSMLELVKNIEEKSSNFENIKGLVYKENGRIKMNEKRELIDNLNSLPFPAWHLMPPKNYPHNPWQLFYKKFPVGYILTSRGCPYFCIYCAAHTTMGRSFRTRSPENVVDEIEYLMRDFNVKELHIVDDNFTFSKEHSYSVCEEMVRRGIKIPWKTPNGISIMKIDNELLSIMKKSGCYEIGFGIESGSEEVLNSARRKYDLSICYQKILEVKKLGIDTYGYFMIGLPGDNKKTVETTISYAKNSPCDLSHFAVCIPYPGSKLFDEWSKKQKCIDWGKFYHFQPFDGISELSPEEIKKMLRIAIIKFYLKPYRVIKILKKIKIRQLFYIFRLTFVYFFPSGK